MCIKCIEPLSFDSPAKTNVVRRFYSPRKVFVSAPAENQTEDHLHGKCTPEPLGHQLFWREMDKMNGGKIESYNTVKDGTKILAVEVGNVR